MSMSKTKLKLVKKYINNMLSENNSKLNLNTLIKNIYKVIVKNKK
jgi:hypothetical protein